jgi:hypothetical protein
MILGRGTLVVRCSGAALMSERSVAGRSSAVFSVFFNDLAADPAAFHLRRPVNQIDRDRLGKSSVAHY